MDGLTKRYGGLVANSDIDFSVQHGGFDPPGDVQSDTILQLENIGDDAIILLGPDLRAVCCVDQVHRDPDAIPALSYAPLQYVAYAQLPADGQHINLSDHPLGRRRGDYEE